MAYVGLLGIDLSYRDDQSYCDDDGDVSGIYHVVMIVDDDSVSGIYHAEMIIDDDSVSSIYHIVMIIDDDSVSGTYHVVMMGQCYRYRPHCDHKTKFQIFTLL